ncbi:MAG: four helix bundle protein [Chloroflexi bacterium]|nr:four helix bundle protein [Chloroflexota bacterium]
MDYEEWERSVPETITGDTLWKMRAYRLALFLSDLGWRDATKLMRDRRTMSLSDQLYRALGSIGANLAEGYSRGTGKDRARFYEYSLGSARESRDWYYKGRHILGETVVQHRLQLLTEVIRLLLTMVPQQRRSILRENSVPYYTGSDNTQANTSARWEKLDDLLRDIPLPTSE